MRHRHRRLRNVQAAVDVEHGTKDTRLRNLPLTSFTQNQLWCEIVALACEQLAWTQMLALTRTAARR